MNGFASQPSELKFQPRLFKKNAIPAQIRNGIAAIYFTNFAPSSKKWIFMFALSKSRVVRLRKLQDAFFRSETVGCSGRQKAQFASDAATARMAEADLHSPLF
jgi:hypothetical protein